MIIRRAREVPDIVLIITLSHKLGFRRFNSSRVQNAKIYNHAKDVIVTASHVIGDAVTKVADGNLRELSGEEAWEAIENFAQGQKEWDNPQNIISEQELANLKAQTKKLFRDENVWVEMHRGDERGPEPPIKPLSPDSFRMKVVDLLTIHTPPLPHLASFLPKDTDCYYHTCINDPKKHYAFKPGLLGQGRGLNLPVQPKEIEKVILIEKKLGSLRKLQWMIQFLDDWDSWKFFIKNKNFIFTERGDGITIYTLTPATRTCDMGQDFPDRAVKRLGYIDEKKLGKFLGRFHGSRILG
ncbi:hypothetical protein Tco_0555678 [Tanacetum coccineum]